MRKPIQKKPDKTDTKPITEQAFQAGTRFTEQAFQAGTRFKAQAFQAGTRFTARIILTGLLIFALLVSCISCGDIMPDTTSSTAESTTAVTEEPTSAAEPSAESTTEPSSETDAPSESESPEDPDVVILSYWEAKEILKKIYAANTEEALFERHRTQGMEAVYEGETEAYYILWRNKDSEFTQQPFMAAYEKDRVIYKLSYPEKGDPFRQYEVDLSEKQDFYVFVSEEEKDFYDPAHCIYTEGYIKDGRITLSFEYDDAWSEETMNSLARKKYRNGMHVTDTIVVDQETLDVLEQHYGVRKTDKEQLLAASYYTYDGPEPGMAKIIRSSFESSAPAFMKLTYVRDAGTYDELVVELEVPKNSYVTAVCDREFLTFGDIKATALNDWDYMTDTTFFIFTDPDEELTQRYKTLLKEAEEAKKKALEASAAAEESTTEEQTVG